MRVVVTGGAGFIGAHTVRALLQSGPVQSVAVVDDFSTGFAANLDGIADVEVFEGSILEPALLDRAFAGGDAVIHLAARPSVPRSLKDPLRTHEVNASGTMQVLEAARRNGGLHAVVASSSSVYGSNPTLPKHEGLTPRPVSPYAASKLATESYALAHGASFGLPVLAFRFFNVFGPFQPAGHAYAAVIPSFLSAALEGEPLTVHGDGKQSRDFTYVGSVAQLLTEAVLRRTTHHSPVNLAFGSRWTLLEVIELIEKIVGVPLAVRHTEPRAGDVPHSQADSTLLRSLFPNVEPVALAMGLERTVDWFRAQMAHGLSEG